MTIKQQPHDGFVFNHTMLRIKDPVVSLKFYEEVLGMTLLHKADFAAMEFSLYFLGKLDKNEQPPSEKPSRTQWTFAQRGVLELTHNKKKKKDADFKYHDGNAKPQGFGHICFAVPDLEKATAWFDENKVEFVKRPGEGKMKDIAFIKDPDGYWIEIVQPSLMGNMGL